MMFKNFWRANAARLAGFWHWVPLLLSAALVSGCRTPMPAVDLKQPGWTVRTGQAVWHIPKGSREIAGEVLVAARPDGECFVQFSKPPFAILSGRARPGYWQVELPPQHKHFAGRGNPPKRLLWLYLPLALAGKPLPEHWTWHQGAEGWSLANHASGESVEGYFNE